MKEFFINIIEDKIIISKNPNPNHKCYEDIINLNKRYLYNEGDKIVNPWGKIETIKEIIRDYNPNQHGYEWLIMVKENGNQYKPCELNGIFIKEIYIAEFDNIIKK